MKGARSHSHPIGGYWPDVNVSILLYVNKSPIDVNFQLAIEDARRLVH